MKIQLLIHVFSIFMANQAVARVIEVRSGEHETFSRIVLNIPEDTEWTLVQTGKSAKLSIELPDIRFDTTRVFSRIPIGRLQRIFQHQPGDALQMSLGCECKVKAFVQSGRLLVVDIQDTEVPAGFSTPNFNTTPILRFSKVTPMSPLRTDFTLSSQSEKSSENTESTTADEPDKSEIVNFPMQETISNVNTSELRLLSQIERAAAQGLVQRNMKTPKPKDAHTAAYSQETVPQRNAGKVETPPHISLTAITSIDYKLPAVAARQQNVEGQHPCMATNIVSLPDWGSNLPFGDQIGNQRSYLFGEFDNVNQQGVVSLTRNLLYFGFGAEAKAALDLFTGDEQTRNVLIALAEILDDGHTTAQNPFLGQQACATDVALWAYLAAPIGAPNGKPNTRAILMAFARLPEHIRVLVGPNLTDRLSNSRELHTAEVVLRTANRAISRPDPALTLSQANMDMLNMDLKSATAQTVLVAQSGTEKSPQALIDLVEIQILADQTIPPSIPDLIAAYLPEYRKSEIAPELRRAHILSLAITGRFAEAFGANLNQNPSGGKLVEDKTLSQVMHLLVERADDIVFLRYAIAQTTYPETLLSITLQNSLARRLIELGFSEQASIILTEYNMGRENGDRKLMNAQIAISKNLPHWALVELLGVNEPLAGNIRTEAFLNIREYENAGKSLEEYGADSSRAFWHAENWEAVIRQRESQFLNAAILAKSLEDTSPNTEIRDSLASAQALANSSVTTRSDISKLLGLVGQADPQN